jgi:hypothetical protein
VSIRAEDMSEIVCIGSAATGFAMPQRNAFGDGAWTFVLLLLLCTEIVRVKHCADAPIKIPKAKSNVTNSKLIKR